MSLTALAIGPSGLAVRNLVQDKFRLALSIVGIALAVMLMVFLLGLRAGLFAGTKAYLAHSPGSVAILPQGVQNQVAGSGQRLPAGTAEALVLEAGVASVTPVLQTRAIPELHGRKETIVLVGYDAALGGGPWDLSQGRGPAADDEVVLDRVLAKRHNVAVGDTFELGGLALKVVGLSDGTSSLGGSYVFARKPAVESLTLAPGATSFLLVTPAQGTSPNELVSRLRERLPGTNVLLKSQVIANDRDFLAGAFDQIIMLMVAAAFIVGALVVGMVLYTATIERRAEYGILKAIGARSGVLYRVVAAQALAAAGLGVLVGIAFAFAMGWLVTTLKPQFLVSIESSAIIAALGAGFVMALIGALVPAKSVVGLEPAEVFRK